MKELSKSDSICESYDQVKKSPVFDSQCIKINGGVEYAWCTSNICLFRLYHTSSMSDAVLKSRWTFLSGSLPSLYYLKVITTLYLLLANKISDLVDHCWIVTCDHHLDDHLSLCHVSDDRVGSINNIQSTKAWYFSGGSCLRHKPMTIRRRQIVQKVSFVTPPPIWRPLKISPPKMEKPTSGTELYYRANFNADRRDTSVPGQKHICPYRGLAWGLLSHVTHNRPADLKL